MLRQNPGFKTLPNQSTFWRAWNERFSEKLRDAVQECADVIVMAARACKVPLPDWIDPPLPDREAFRVGDSLDGSVFATIDVIKGFPFTASKFSS